MANQFLAVRNILIIAAHPDDAEIGAGGLSSRSSLEYGARIHVAILTDETDHALSRLRREEALVANASINGFGVEEAGQTVSFGGFPDGGLSAVPGREPVSFVEAAIRRSEPDIVIAHWHEDSHQDHVAAARIATSALRSYVGTVLFFRSPSSPASRFPATVYVRFGAMPFERKRQALAAFRTQEGRIAGYRGDELGRTWLETISRRPVDDQVELFVLDRLCVDGD